MLFLFVHLLALWVLKVTFSHIACVPETLDVGLLVALLSEPVSLWVVPLVCFLTFPQQLFENALFFSAIGAVWDGPSPLVSSPGGKNPI